MRRFCSGQAWSGSGVFLREQVPWWCWLAALYDTEYYSCCGKQSAVHTCWADWHGLAVAGQPTQVQTWEKWKKVSTFKISQGLKRKESLNIPTFPGVEREGKKGGEKSRERGDGEKPKAGRKTPKAAATQCSSWRPPRSRRPWLQLPIPSRARHRAGPRRRRTRTRPRPRTAWQGVTSWGPWRRTC